MWNMLGDWLKREAVFFVSNAGVAIGIIPMAVNLPFRKKSKSMLALWTNLHEFNDRTGRPLAEFISELCGGEVDFHASGNSRVSSRRVALLMVFWETWVASSRNSCQRT